MQQVFHTISAVVLGVIWFPQWLNEDEESCVIHRRQSRNGLWSQNVRSHAWDSQAQLVSELPEHDQENDIGGIFQKVEWRSCALIQRLLAI